jgi:hypothetical protein
VGNLKPPEAGHPGDQPTDDEEQTDATHAPGFSLGTDAAAAGSTALTRRQLREALKIGHIRPKVTTHADSITVKVDARIGVCPGVAWGNGKQGAARLGLYRE